MILPDEPEEGGEEEGHADDCHGDDCGVLCAGGLCSSEEGDEVGLGEEDVPVRSVAWGRGKRMWCGRVEGWRY